MLNPPGNLEEMRRVTRLDVCFPRDPPKEGWIVPASSSMGTFSGESTGKDPNSFCKSPRISFYHQYLFGRRKEGGITCMVDFPPTKSLIAFETEISSSVFFNF